MDIVERLRADVPVTQFDSAGRTISFDATPSPLDLEAADLIDSLRKERGALKAAVGELNINRCVCRLDASGNIAEECMEHLAIRKERDALREALNELVAVTEHDDDAATILAVQSARAAIAASTGETEPPLSFAPRRLVIEGEDGEVIGYLPATDEVKEEITPKSKSAATGET